nr:unnamed protein product [Spirometra erinaceieuropaei]
MYQFDTLNEIMKKPASAEEIKKIQSMPACNGLDLNSFLVLPMQRVMRLRLLVVAVLHYTPRSSPAYISGLVALASIETLVETCNREKGHMEQKQRLLTLAKQLEFKGSIAAVGTGSRQLLKEGNLRLTAAPSNQSGAFRRKFSDVVKNRPTVVTLFLFTDVLLISRRKGDKYLVEEVCPRDKIRVTVEYTPASAVIKVSEYTMKKPANADDFFVQPKLLPSREVRNSRMHESSNPPSRSSSLRHLRSSSGSRSPLRNSSGIYDDTATPIFPFILTCQTEEGIVDYHFMADSLNQRERWLDALKENYYSVPNGVTYDTWDCPQVLAITGHGPTEPDELDVKEGDLMNVIVDLSDGLSLSSPTSSRTAAHDIRGRMNEWVPYERSDQLKGHSFAQIFTVVPLYQIYVAKTQYSGEFKRIGQRFRESLRTRSQPKLADELQRLQRSPACNGLDLNSFLVLPMQRIVRLRLLVIAVLKYTDKTSNAYRSGLLALASLEKLISECNAQTGYMEKKERLLTLSNQLEFQNSMRAIAMENRELVKEGNMNLIITPNAYQAGTRRKISDVMRCKPTKMTLFLISDLLLITRPKGEKFYVVEVCPLEKVRASAEQPAPGFDTLAMGDQRLPNATDPADSGGSIRRHSHHRKSSLTRSNFERISIRSRRSEIIVPRNVAESSTVSILEGNSCQDLQEFPLCLTVETAEGATRSYHLLADSLNSRERWLDLLRPGHNSAPEQTDGTQNVFRQVIATTSHSSTEGDEIEVREGDIMNVIVDLPDGWYKCALPDGRAGWIPKTICSELDEPTGHQLNLRSFELSKEAKRVYEEMKRRDRGTVFQRLRAFFDNDL